MRMFFSGSSSFFSALQINLTFISEITANTVLLAFLHISPFSLFSGFNDASNPFHLIAARRLRNYRKMNHCCSNLNSPERGNECQRGCGFAALMTLFMLETDACWDAFSMSINTSASQILDVSR